jgi:hypothetical protein
MLERCQDAVHAFKCMQVFLCGRSSSVVNDVTNHNLCSTHQLVVEHVDERRKCHLPAMCCYSKLYFVSPSSCCAAQSIEMRLAGWLQLQCCMTNS